MGIFIFIVTIIIIVLIIGNHFASKEMMFKT
jgi:hypothetical protein